MADKYRNFQELRTQEPDDAYRIIVRDNNCPTAIIAPHGGKIEPGTSQIAIAIAGDALSLYCFEGCKAANNSNLHITSTNFDEPRAIQIVSNCDYVLAIHGCAGDEGTIYLGGRDKILRDAIGEVLRSAGFNIGVHTNPALQGISPHNICNRGRRNCGVQLEVSRNLRDELRASAGASRIEELGASIRGAISA
jgi:phage replication-related protein YjqB (UPF0714/DUF867 family)